MVKLDLQELDELNLYVKDKDPFTIIEWICRAAYAKEKIAMTTSFQISGVVIMHMLKKLDISIPIFFMDTGFHLSVVFHFLVHPKTMLRMGKGQGDGVVIQRVNVGFTQICADIDLLK